MLARGVERPNTFVVGRQELKVCSPTHFPSRTRPRSRPWRSGGNLDWSFAGRNADNIDPKFAEHRGRIVKTTGDGYWSPASDIFLVDSKTGLS